LLITLSYLLFETAAQPAPRTVPLALPLLITLSYLLFRNNRPYGRLVKFFFHGGMNNEKTKPTD
jgi:hypothetical protein